MAARSGTGLSLLVLSALLATSIADAGDGPRRGCSRSSSMVGFESGMAMVQHQLRGVVRLLDDCSFAVSGFDMIAGADVRWWGAAGDDFENLTAGFEISDQPLNRTFKNETFTVFLKPNLTWDQIRVIAVWDKPTFSDFGHVVVGIPPNPALSPSPSPATSNTGYQQPTMFDSCKFLAPNFRLRWTLYAGGVADDGHGSIEIGLEAAVSSQSYMAFGWAKPGSSSSSSSSYMLHSDVTVAGFTEESIPFADDYFITKYSECLLSKDGLVEGVCQDSIYEGSDPVGLVNNTRLVYGHRKDGVSFIRYRRGLDSVDDKYDVVVDKGANMTVVWALGLIRPPDTLRPYYLPQNHGGPRFVSYGYFDLNVSEVVDECVGPLEAADREDQDFIFADGKTPLVVGSGPALHYPNPPNPGKVLYVNKKEAPVLRVERGVPVQFSIQAGHDVALYVTSDRVGGNATLRNSSEVIYAGGPGSEGVPASPTELVWLPDRNTPDQVYYHSLFEPKMGWKVLVVDGGLSDMYSNNVVLDDQQVNFFWTLYNDSISIAARAEKKSGYLAIGFGGGMVNSFVYVGWIDDTGIGRVNSYWIDGQDAASIHRTHENLTYVRCKIENGIITFEFTRPLELPCDKGSIECNNKIDPTTPLRVVWAMGAKWSEDRLTERNMHSATSSRPVRVMLMRGSAEADQDLRPVLAVHGFMMYVSWGILLPGGILAARYLKHVKGDWWFQTHVYLQYSGLAISLLGVLFAAAELRGYSLHSTHVKFGVIAMVLACLQAINGYLRPAKPTNGTVESSSRRVLWEYVHTISGRCGIIIGIAALITGLKHLGERYGGEDVRRLIGALVTWFALGALLVAYLEYCEIKQKRRDRNLGRGNWVLGNTEEDDSIDLLQTPRDENSHPSDHMEVQLQPLGK